MNAPSINWMAESIDVTDRKAIEVLNTLRAATFPGSDAYEALTQGIVALTIDMRERAELVSA